MRYINEIIVHCTGTKAIPGYGAKQIKAYHVNVNHWKDIGYHFVIRTDGTIEAGRPLIQAGAHCQGHNQHSIGIAYVGGLDAKGKPADTRTPEQKKALKQLILKYKKYYSAKVSGHRDYNPGKACPCFDARREYGEEEEKKAPTQKPQPIQF